MMYTDSINHCSEDNVRQEKPCAFDNCTGTGEYPAPKSPENVYERIWLCLKHVRSHNASWNYYTGLNVGEIESHWRNCATWERPTWPLGSNFSYCKIHDHLKRFTGDAAFAQKGADNTDAYSKFFHPGSKAAKALITLEIEGDFDADSLKKAYKTMVKKHHPDANQGCKQSEEKLKEINEAYSEIKMQMSEIICQSTDVR